MTTAGATRHSNLEHIPISVTPASASLDRRDTGPVLPSAGAMWPKNVTARIQKAERSTTTSGLARSKGWRLTFERRRAPVLDPLMGWTGGDDPLAHAELSFPTLEAAICYAEGQGLSDEVTPPPGASDRKSEQLAVAARVFSDATLERLGLRQLQDRYSHAMASAAKRDDPAGQKAWRDPMDVVTDPTLSLEAKRSVLMNWAWSEYLAGLATADGMPEHDWPSRLAEVEQALRTLEGRVSTQAGTTRETKLVA